MAKKKKTTKKKAVRRKVKPADVAAVTRWESAPQPAAYVPLPTVEVVLVPVPVEKTKTSTWHQFVDWLKGQ